MSARVPALYSSTQRFRPVFAALREVGVDVDAALARVGFSEAQLLDPACRVPREYVVDITGQLIWMSRQPAIGVRAAELFELPDLGLLGYLMRHAASPLAALEQLVRFQRLIADAADISFVVRDAQVIIRAVLVGQRPMVAPAVDFSIGLIAQTLSLLSDGARPRAVQLPRPRQGDLAPYHRVFGRGVRFDAPEAELVYDARALRGACPRSDPLLAGILTQHAQLMMARLPDRSDFVEQVRACVERQIERGELRVSQVAEELALTERTLRRRLARQGSSFRDLLDRARCDHATIGLNEGKLSITDIAYRLGFADATAFTRSFRRWTGKTPAEVVRERAAVRRGARVQPRPEPAARATDSLSVEGSA